MHSWLSDFSVYGSTNNKIKLVFWINLDLYILYGINSILLFTISAFQVDQVFPYEVGVYLVSLHQCEFALNYPCLPII